MSLCFWEPRNATLAQLTRKIASDLGTTEKIHKHIFKSHDCTWKTKKCAIISSFKDFYSLAKRFRRCSENSDFFDSALHLHSKNIGTFRIKEKKGCTVKLHNIRYMLSDDTLVLKWMQQKGLVKEGTFYNFCFLYFPSRVMLTLGETWG